MRDWALSPDISCPGAPTMIGAEEVVQAKRVARSRGIDPGFDEVILVAGKDARPSEVRRIDIRRSRAREEDTVQRARAPVERVCFMKHPG